MDVKVASRLYDLRRQKGLSQEELADKLGVTRQAVSKWERAESSPDTDNLIALAKLYGVSLDELIGFEEAKERINSDAQTGDESGEDKDNDNDNKEYFNFDIKDGENRVKFKLGNIDINDGKNTVKLGKDGILINDGKSYVKLGMGGIEIKDGESEDTEESCSGESCCNNIHFKNGKIVIEKSGEIKKGFFACLPVTLIIVIAYIVMGTVWDLWHPGWLVFLLIPIYYGTVEAVVKRNANHFPYPIFCAGAYLLTGFLANIWHPTWVIFISIPVYYSLSTTINRLRRK